MSVVSVADAAVQLRVSPARVRAMIAAGQLDAEKVAGVWLVEVASLPSARRRAGQPYSPRIAWAFMRLADGEAPADVSGPELSRLRARLRTLLTDPHAIATLRSVLARRGRRIRLHGPEPGGLLDDHRVIRSGRSDPRSRMLVQGYAEGYAREGDLAALTHEHLLVPARGAENVLLRAVPDLVGLRAHTPAPTMAVVADLAEAGSREERQSGNLWSILAARLGEVPGSLAGPS